jgi:hypothetical protein
LCVICFCWLEIFFFESLYGCGYHKDWKTIMIRKLLETWYEAIEKSVAAILEKWPLEWLILKTEGTAVYCRFILRFPIL